MIFIASSTGVIPVTRDPNATEVGSGRGNFPAGNRAVVCGKRPLIALFGFLTMSTSSAAKAAAGGFAGGGGSIAATSPGSSNGNAAAATGAQGHGGQGVVVVAF